MENLNFNSQLKGWKGALKSQDETSSKRPIVHEVVPQKSLNNPGCGKDASTVVKKASWFELLGNIAGHVFSLATLNKAL